jgi:AhpD family alkylhydroperoxidase
MARVPYVHPEDAPPGLQAAYESTQRMNGRVANFHRILGHVPNAYPWYQGLQFSLQRDTAASDLSPQLRQLAHLATSEANRCRYCAAHNASLALKRGIAKEKVTWLNEHPDDDPSPDLFDEAERLVIRWSRAVTHNRARQDMELFAELENVFSQRQIVELTVIVAARTFTNLIQEALWTDLEEPGDPHAAPVDPPGGRPPARELLREHARMILGELERTDESQRVASTGT